MFKPISVIPLAAEHNFLEWLDTRFSKMTKNEAWSAWLQLLRLVYNPCAQDTEQIVNSNDETNNLIDVEIFDDTEPNIFDETIYTAYNCFNYVVKNMKNCASLDADSKEKIFSEYSALKIL